jgi:hypothetical protein
MNLNLINKYCDDWTRTDWQDAYAQYCQHNMFGVKTKREYYEFVKECHNRLKLAEQPLSDELKRTWTIGRRNARLWAKKHGCDMNGRLLSDVPPKDAVAIAEHAEEIAIDTALKMSYYDRDKGRKTNDGNNNRYSR